MYNTEKFYKVIEEQVTSEGQFACIQTDFTEAQKKNAYSNLYQIWSAASLNAGGLQYHSGALIEYGHDKAILLEAKVFDYRQPEPAPEPEPEPEEET